jgi:Pentatricopeptide repeat domain
MPIEVATVMHLRIIINMIATISSSLLLLYFCLSCCAITISGLQLSPPVMVRLEFFGNSATTTTTETFCSQRTMMNQERQHQQSFFDFSTKANRLRSKAKASSVNVMQRAASTKNLGYDTEEAIREPQQHYNLLTSTPTPTNSSSSNIMSDTRPMAHYYPSSSSPLKKVAKSRKTQIRWITQTVQKLVQHSFKHQHFSNKDIDNNLSHPTNGSTYINDRDVYNATASQMLIDGLQLLCIARTQVQVIDAGRVIESANKLQTQALPIQERIVKATSMTGLLHIAIQIMHHMLHNVQYLPSPICQDAISDGLRRAGRIQQLQDVLYSLGSVARTQNKSVSVITFNTYLASLCDVVTGKDDAVQQQQQQQRSSSTCMVVSSSGGLDGLVGDTANFKITALDRAWYCIEDVHRTMQTMAVIPDSVSYATVIQAAACVGNQTIVDAIWKVIRTRNVPPNIVAYNARLRSSTYRSHHDNSGMVLSRLGQQKHCDQEILKVWDTEISRDPHVTSDKYTIDLLLLPLIRSGRVRDVVSLLDHFIKRNSEMVVSNAFTAFLLTIVSGGEFSTARAVFEMYILPTFSPVVVGDAGGMIRMVRPTTRHFNVMIEGYRKKFQKDYSNNDTTTTTDTIQEAWSLYSIMKQSLNARPDSYTITSMMGLCQTSTELTNLIIESIVKLNIDCSSVVLRAACE